MHSCRFEFSAPWMTGKNLTPSKIYLSIIQYTSDKITGWYAGNDSYWMGISVTSKGSKSFVTLQNSFENLSAKNMGKTELVLIMIINSRGTDLKLHQD